MTIIFLQNIFEKSINGEWGNEDSGKGEATAVIRTSNFLNSGRLNLDNIVCREIDKDKNSDKILRTGDIIIEKSGGSPNQPVGRVVYFDVTDQDYFTNNFTSILRVKPGYNSKYIFYLMKYLYDTKKVLKFQNQTTGIINLKLADYLNKTKVNIEIIENQNTIVDILDRLEYQIINRNKQLSELSNLVKSRFNEMFGDPVLNEIGWDKHALKEFGIWKSGGTPKRNEEEFFRGNIPWITSGELEHKYIEDSFEKITEKAIECSSAKIIEKGSLLLGMYDTAGLKSSINTKVISCNQAIAFAKLDDKITNTIYVYYVIQNLRSTLLNQQRGVRQKNFNLSMIKNISIPLPPLALQNEFADFVAQVDKSQFTCEIAIKVWRNSLKFSII